MLLRIVSTDGELYCGDVVKILLPTKSGMLGIFPKHMNLTTPLSVGVVFYSPVDKKISDLNFFVDHSHSKSISGGLAMIEDDIVTIVVE